MNNMQICAMGYGAAITSAASLHAMDRLGNAQYITRIGMALSGGDSSATDAAKKDWLEKEQWQGLRKVVEDTFVVDDWFELFVAQNLVMDGLVHALFFDRLEKKLNEEGGATYSMLTEFIVNWNAESSRWVDKQVAVAVAESDANKKRVSDWYNKWLQEMTTALMPLADAAFDNGADVLTEVKQALDQRAKKIGINL
jgi:phenol hydroxylase P1 protein